MLLWPVFAPDATAPLPPTDVKGRGVCFTFLANHCSFHCLSDRCDVSSSPMRPLDDCCRNDRRTLVYTAFVRLPAIAAGRRAGPLVLTASEGRSLRIVRRFLADTITAWKLWAMIPTTSG